MRKSSVIILIVATLMGGSAAYLTRTWLNNQVSVSAAHQPAGTIVVAAESLAYGATLTPDSVVEIPWFSNTLPEGAFAAKDDLINGGRRIVLSPLKRGEAVLRSKVTGPGQRASLASVLDEGKRAVTVPVDDVRGVAGFVLPGDFVDIVSARKISAEQVPSLRDPRTSGQGSSAAAVEYGDDFRFPKWGNQAVLGDAQRHHQWPADERSEVGPSRLESNVCFLPRTAANGRSSRSVSVRSTPPGSSGQIARWPSRGTLSTIPALMPRD